MSDDDTNDTSNAYDDDLYDIEGLADMLDQLQESTNRVGHRPTIASAPNNRDASRRHCHYQRP